MGASKLSGPLRRRIARGESTPWNRDGEESREPFYIVNAVVISLICNQFIVRDGEETSGSRD